RAYTWRRPTCGRGNPWHMGQAGRTGMPICGSVSTLRSGVRGIAGQSSAAYHGVIPGRGRGARRSGGGHRIIWLTVDSKRVARWLPGATKVLATKVRQGCLLAVFEDLGNFSAQRPGRLLRLPGVVTDLRPIDVHTDIDPVAEWIFRRGYRVPIPEITQDGHTDRQQDEG